MRLTRAASKAANRQALLDAARDLVSRGGAAVSVDAIASAADLTTGAVYSIFGSKNDLLAALIAENMARIDEFLAPISNPALTLEQAVDAYVDAWLATYELDTLAQSKFELQVLVSAVEDTSLTEKLTLATASETAAIVKLFTNRRMPGADGSHDRTSPEQARDVALAIQAFLSGFTLRESFAPDQSIALLRRACHALSRVATLA
jgi:AcrR family transcriptional regulator